jgi:hypothetical protein
MEETRICSVCEEEYPISFFDNFVHRGKMIRSGKCKECRRDRDRNERLEHLKEMGGSEVMSPKPNTYKDIYQKEQTFLAMKAFGWKFNEAKGIWYDNRLKDENGVWLVPLGTKRQGYSQANKYKFLKKLVTPETLPKIEYKYDKNYKTSEDTINKAMWDYYINKMLLRDVLVKHKIDRKNFENYQHKINITLNEMYLQGKLTENTNVEEEPDKRKKRFLFKHQLPDYEFYKNYKHIPYEHIKKIVALYFNECKSIREIVNLYDIYEYTYVQYVITKTLTMMKNAN